MDKAGSKALLAALNGLDAKVKPQSTDVRPEAADYKYG